MSNSYTSTRNVKQVSYADYEYKRLNMMQEALMKHHAKNFSQLVKDLMRKEYQLITL